MSIIYKGKTIAGFGSGGGSSSNSANIDLSNLSEIGQQIIDNKANIDLSNLSEEAIQKINGTILETLDNKVDLDGGNYVGSGLEQIISETSSNINDKITNCLLEVPQRITLSSNGSLYTINPDSTFIFPYGTEYPTGEDPDIDYSSVTIDEDGIASGFTTENYIHINKAVTGFQEAVESFDMAFKFRTGDTVTSEDETYQYILGGYDDSGHGYSAPAIYIYSDGCLIVTTSGAEIYVEEPLQPNTDYWAKVHFSGTNSDLVLELSTDGVTYTTYTEFAKYIYWDQYAPIGCLEWASPNTSPVEYEASNPFLGSIDLNETYIKANGEYIFKYAPPKSIVDDYPVGSIFQQVFEIVDRQVSDGKFFIWAKPLADIRINPPRMEKGLGIITNAGNCLTGNPELFCSSDVKPAETTIQFWYDTKANMVKRLSNTGDIVAEGYTLPIFAFDTSFTNYITQVFNGFGYMDSVVWVDKDVKGLIPKRFNSDGSYKNIKWTNDRLLVSNGQLFSDANCLIQLDGRVHHSKYWGEYSTPPTASGSNGSYYNTTQNAFYYNTGSTWVEANVLRLVDITGTTTITSFNPKQPFRAVDSNEFKPLVQNLVQGLIRYDSSTATLYIGV